MILSAQDHGHCYPVLMGKMPRVLYVVWGSVCFPHYFPDIMFHLGLRDIAICWGGYAFICALGAGLTGSVVGYRVSFLLWNIAVLFDKLIQCGPGDPPGTIGYFCSCKPSGTEPDMDGFLVDTKDLRHLFRTQKLCICGHNYITNDSLYCHNHLVFCRVDLGI